MSRWFNTAGPCKPDKHYMLPATERLPSIRRLIEQEGYFVLHAPRQTGKTTAVLSLAQQLTAEGKYAALMVSAEVGAIFSKAPMQAEAAILSAWRDGASFWLPEALQPPDLYNFKSIGQALRAWANQCDRPVVLFIDEIDALQDDALVSVLRQLRDGYPRRPEAFPQSLALIGLRDVRDYKVTSGGSDRLGTTSPFNIKIESLTLRNFTHLHRVINGGGTLEREYALGTGRMDLCLQYGQETLGIELKVWRESRPDPLERGLEQLDRYLARLGEETGWLVIFDRRSGLDPIEARTTAEAVKSPEGRSIMVVRG